MLFFAKIHPKKKLPTRKPPNFCVLMRFPIYLTCGEFFLAIAPSVQSDPAIQVFPSVSPSEIPTP
jgi:hypothetical protein